MDLITVTDFAPIGLVNAAKASWPDARWPHWHRYVGEYGDKLASKDPTRLPAACQELIRRMAELTVPDDNCFPDLDLHAAGMHWIRQGGRLPLHRDAEVHPTLGWRRRFNAILYLDECEGGQLRFDSGETVAPQVNVLAAFPVSKPHEVLPVKRGERRSLSLFWWDLLPIDGAMCADFSVRTVGPG